MGLPVLAPFSSLRAASSRFVPIQPVPLADALDRKRHAAQFTGHRERPLSRGEQHPSAEPLRLNGVIHGQAGEPEDRESGGARGDP